MALPERLQIILELKGDQYKREVRQVASATGRVRDSAQQAGTATQRMDTSVKTLGTSSRGLTTSLGGVAKGFAVFAAGGAIARGVSSAIDRAEEMNSLYAITEQVIRQTGGAAGVTAEQIKTLAKEQSILTGVDKALVTEAANVILTFKNIKNAVGEGNDVFDRTAALALDVATVMETSVPAAAVQLAKALNDPITNLGALSRAGLTFNDQQKEQIKTLTESGNLMTAQKIILSELESQLGGTAAAAADASDKVANSLKEISEAAGQLFLPLLDTAAIELQHIAGLTDELERYGQITGQSADTATLLAGALNELGQEYDELQGHGQDAARETGEFRDEAAALVDQFEGGIPELQKVRDNLDLLVDSFDLTRDQAAILAEVLDEELLQQLGLLEATDADQALLNKIAPALAEAREESEGLADGLADINQQLQNLVSPALSALDALDKHLASQEALNAAIRDYGADSQEANEAGRDVLETYEGLIGAAATYAQQSGKDIVESIRELGEQAGIPRDVIQGIVEQLQLLDGFVANATIDLAVRGGDAFGSINSIRRGGPRQHGGETNPGLLHQVGEGNQPELYLIPGDRGRVFSNRDSRALIAALSSGGPAGGAHHHYHLEGTGDPEVDAQRLGATYSVVRRMETR